MSKDAFISTIEEVYAHIREFIVGEHALEDFQAYSMWQLQHQVKLSYQQERITRFHESALACIAAFPSTDKLTKAQKAHVKRLSNAIPDLNPADTNEYIIQVKELMPSRSDQRWEEQVPSLYELYELEWKPLKKEWGLLGKATGDPDGGLDLLERMIALLQRFDHAYRERKHNLGALDFSDLQQKAVALLENEEVRSACRNHYRHMMVDEFQDTNQLQMEMLNRIRPDYQFIVGDPKQSIYRFRGADVSLMNAYEQKALTGEHGHAIAMNTNYRTYSPIIEAVNALFAEVMKAEKNEGYTTRYDAFMRDGTWKMWRTSGLNC